MGFASFMLFAERINAFRAKMKMRSRCCRSNDCPTKNATKMPTRSCSKNRFPNEPSPNCCGSMTSCCYAKNSRYLCSSCAKTRKNRRLSKNLMPRRAPKRPDVPTTNGCQKNLCPKRLPADDCRNASRFRQLSKGDRRCCRCRSESQFHRRSRDDCRCCRCRGGCRRCANLADGRRGGVRYRKDDSRSGAEQDDSRSDSSYAGVAGVHIRSGGDTWGRSA